MQRVSPRAIVTGLALAGGLIAAMLVVFMLSTTGGQGTSRAFAVDPVFASLGCSQAADPAVTDLTPVNNLNTPPAKPVDIAIIANPGGDLALTRAQAVMNKTAPTPVVANNLPTAIAAIQTKSGPGATPLNVWIIGHGSPGSAEVGGVGAAGDYIGNGPGAEQTNEQTFINALNTNIKTLKLIACSVAAGPNGKAFLAKLMTGLNADNVSGFSGPIAAIATDAAGDYSIFANKWVEIAGSKQDVTPKVTPIATPTGGNISGVYDIHFDFITNGQFNCISRTEEATDLSVKSATTCNADTGGTNPDGSGGGIGDLNAEPPSHSGQPQPQGGDGSNGNCGPPASSEITAAGCMPPPPPYTIQPPSKGFGSVDGGGTLTLYTCFENIGGTNDNPSSLGPNVIAKVIVPNYAAVMTASGKIHILLSGGNGAGTNPGGTLYTNQGSAQCKDPTHPTGTPFFTIRNGIGVNFPIAFGIDFYAADANNHLCTGRVGGGGDNGCVPAPWRGTATTHDNINNNACPCTYTGNLTGGLPDWDKDGCTDAQELYVGKPGFASKCGDDAWNPNDPMTGTDTAGVWDALATGAEQDACWNNTWAHQGDTSFAIQFDCNGKPDGALVPGAYYNCAAYITTWAAGATPAPGKTLTGKILCNIDFINLTTNAQAAGGKICVGDGTPAPTPNPVIAARQFCGDGSPGAAPPGCNPDTSPVGASTPTPVPCQPPVQLLTGAATATPPCLPGLGTPQDGTCGGALPHKATPGPAAHCPAFLNGSGSTATVKINCQPNRWLFAHVNNAATKQAKLTGTVDNGTNMINLSGCFKDPNGALGNVWINAKADVQTGHGLVAIYIAQPDNCSPPGSGTPNGGTLPFDLVREAPAIEAPGTQAGFTATNWDRDGDGCPDARELTDVANGGAAPPASLEGGGLRDPSNRWDFFDPYKADNARKHTSSDITAVVRAFGKDEWKKDPANPGVNPPLLNALYDPAFDRTVIGGSNSWNLGAPNGYVKSDDITNAVKSFGQTCGPAVQTLPVNQ